MEVKNVEWSKKLYSVKEIMRSANLPIISKVETAYFGEKNLETFSAGQVLWVMDTQQQRCVIAEDKKGNHISIPLNTTVRFHMLNKKTSKSPNKDEEESKILNELMYENDLPIKVKFNMEDVSTLILDGASQQASWFQELTLTSQHDLPYLIAVCISKNTIQPDIQCLPVYLQEEFSIGQKLIDTTSGTDWNKFRAHYNGLVKQMVDLKNYSGSQEIIVYPADEVKNLKASSTDYESLVPHRLDVVYEELDKSTNKKEEKAKKKKKSKKDKILQVKQESLQDSIKSQLKIAKKERRPPIAEKPRKKATEEVVYEDVDCDTVSPPAIPKRETYPSSTSSTLKQTRVFPTETNRDSTIQNETDAYLVPTVLTQSVNQEYVVITKDKPDVELKKTPAKNLLTEDNTAAELLKSPGKTAQPTTIIEIVKNKPRTLKISQVQECLKLLGMEQYLPVFKENCIDGELLYDMSNEILVDELGMTKLNALKLKKFITGEWVPESLN
ncbi:uncharacterized protein [Antedon mediterranea]|uniref:uncharacterized protein n=1 Tax=Antedon mediterranea TaxID=105859 RepID=UPI003AF7BE06